jgi:putative ABC transport system permease protein
MYWYALKMLFRDRLKFITLVIGLTFSVLLISQQSSIFCGLMRRFSANISNVNPPIWISDAGIKFIDDVKPLADTDLTRVRSIDGLEWAVPYFQRLTQVMLHNGSSENVYLVGLDAHSLIGLPQKVVAGDIMQINTPDAVVVDLKGLKKLGFPNILDSKDFSKVIGETFEINDQRARIVAVVDVMQGFQSLPYVYCTYDRAITYTPPQRKQLSYILAKAAPGHSEAEILQKITKETGLAAYNENQFVAKTIEYFLKNTGIPINFGVTVLLGVIVGAAIAAQTFYTFVLENIRQFATMKAMGTSNSTLTRMILLQSITVSFIGYGLGVGLMALFGTLVASKSELSFWTPWPVLVIAFVAVVVVGLSSSLVSIFKVLRVEPATVFR